MNRSLVNLQLAYAPWSSVLHPRSVQADSFRVAQRQQFVMVTASDSQHVASCQHRIESAGSLIARQSLWICSRQSYPAPYRARERERERESVFDLRQESGAHNGNSCCMKHCAFVLCNICVVCSCVPYIMHSIKRLPVGAVRK